MLESFAKHVEFVYQSYGNPRDSYGNSMDSCGNPEGILWKSIEIQWKSYGNLWNLKELLQRFHGDPMQILWISCASLWEIPWKPVGIKSKPLDKHMYNYGIHP